MELSSECSGEDSFGLSDAAINALSELENQKCFDTLSALSFGPQSQLSYLASGSLAAHAPIEAGQNLTSAEFRDLFREDWQLSQFWYDDETCALLLLGLKDVLDAHSERGNTRARVGFLCCPTGFVAFKNSREHHREQLEVYLFEKDTRFATLADTGCYVEYDLDEPLAFERVDELENTFDILIVDPPFHSHKTQVQLATTCSHLFNKSSPTLLLLTGSKFTAEELGVIYNFPNKFFLTTLPVKHSSGLENGYGCFTNFETESAILNPV